MPLTMDFAHPYPPTMDIVHPYLHHPSLSPTSPHIIPPFTWFSMLLIGIFLLLYTQWKIPCNLNFTPPCFFLLPIEGNTHKTAQKPHYHWHLHCKFCMTLAVGRGNSWIFWYLVFKGLLQYLLLQDILSLTPRVHRGAQFCRRWCSCRRCRRSQCMSPPQLLCWSGQGSVSPKGFRGYIPAF